MVTKKVTNVKAVSLVELIITLGIISFVIAGMFALFLFGSNTFSWGNIQYNIQSDMRLASDEILKRVRYSTDVKLLTISEATYIANKSDPTANPLLSFNEGYSYIYVNSDKNQLIHAYKKNGNLVETIFSVSDMDINIKFFSEDTNRQILGMKIEAVSKKDASKKYLVNNETKIMNLHLGSNPSELFITPTDTDKTKFNALEYRTPEFYIESQLPLQITAFSSSSQDKIIVIDFNKVIEVSGIDNDPNNLKPDYFLGKTSMDDGAPSRLTITLEKKPAKGNKFRFNVNDFYTAGSYELTYDNSNKWVYSNLLPPIPPPATP